VVQIDGTMGTANAAAIAAELARLVSVCTPLVLDVSVLESMGPAGARALIAVSYWFREAGLQWALVPGLAARPYLPDLEACPVLPLADSVDDALHRLSTASPRDVCRPLIARRHTHC
jgi:hypothetical protein